MEIPVLATVVCVIWGWGIGPAIIELLRSGGPQHKPNALSMIALGFMQLACLFITVVSAINFLAETKPPNNTPHPNHSETAQERPASPASGARSKDAS